MDDFSLEDALIILQRRWIYLILPAVAIAILGIAVVMLLPAKYTAQGTILVESAQIPSELARSTISTYAQERIQMIRQRVMTRERLLEIADRYRLFEDSPRLSDTEQAKKMRERLNVSLITANAARVSGQRDGTIAFTVSYIDRSPDKAFQVANEFMTLFLSEDVRTRTAGASNTTEFFKEESERVAAQVSALETRIAEYKSEHKNSLPEHLNLHLNMLERAQRDLAANEAGTTALDEELRFLESQLTSLLAGENSENGPSTELTRLKSQLAQLRSVYHDTHPEIQGVRAQIRALEAQLAPNKEIQDLQSTLAAAELDLKDARRTLEKGDPAIEEKENAVEAAQKKLSDRIAREANSGAGGFLTSQTQARIAVANSRRETLVEQADEIRDRIADYQTRIANTPEVERGLQLLTRDSQNLQREYEEIKAKQQEAQLAENLEDSQKAEKFSILEPAQRPESPSSPERMKLGVLVLFLAGAAGAGLALGLEFLFPTIRGKSHLEKLIDGDPIAVIPNFDRANDNRRRIPAFSGKEAA